MDLFLSLSVEPSWCNGQMLNKLWLKYVTLTLMHFPFKPPKPRSCIIIISISILAHFPHYPLIPSKLEALKWKANQEFVFISV